jgi:hypothetical protein
VRLQMTNAPDSDTEISPKRLLLSLRDAATFCVAGRDCKLARFAKLQAAMLRALQEFPDARDAVVAALRGLGSENTRTGTASPAMAR